DVNGNPVAVIGSGPATVLDDQRAGDYVTLSVLDAASRFSSLRVVLPPGGNKVGVTNNGTVDHLTVSGSATDSPSLGIQSFGTVDSTTVDMPGDFSTGVGLYTGRVSRTRISATHRPVYAGKG